MHSPLRCKCYLIFDIDLVLDDTHLKSNLLLTLNDFFSPGHDDRTLHSDRGSKPRVSFKMSRIEKGGRGDRNDKQRGMETAMRLHLEDDVDMSNEVKRNRFRGNGRGSSRGARYRFYLNL